MDCYSAIIMKQEYEPNFGFVNSKLKNNLEQGLMVLVGINEETSTKIKVSGTNSCVIVEGSIVLNVNHFTHYFVVLNYIGHL